MNMRKLRKKIGSSIEKTWKGKGLKRGLCRYQLGFQLFSLVRNNQFISTGLKFACALKLIGALGQVSHKSNYNNGTDGEKHEYKIPILSDRETDLTKIVVGTNLRKHRLHSSPKYRWGNGPRNRIIACKYRTSHQRWRNLGSGPESETQTNERLVGQGTERRQCARTTEAIQENVPTHEKRIPLFL